MVTLKPNSPGVAERAVSVLESGRMLVYPTDTLYALGADATRHDCVRQIFAMKKRDPEHPVSVMVSSFRMLSNYAEMSEEQMRIAKGILPGKVTLIVEAKGLAPNLSASGVAFRIPLSPFAAEIVDLFNKPVTATSANPSGEQAAESCTQAYGYFGDLVDLYVDGGTLGGVASTVVDLRDTPEIVREGADLERVLNVISTK